MDQTENNGASLTDIGTEKKNYDAILVVGFVYEWKRGALEWD